MSECLQPTPGGDDLLDLLAELKETYERATPFEVGIRYAVRRVEDHLKATRPSA